MLDSFLIQSSASHGFQDRAGPAGGSGEDLKNRLQRDIIFDYEINYLNVTKSLINLNTRIDNKITGQGN